MSTIKADYLVNAAGTGAPTLTNGAVLPAGSAAAPAISPTGDSNTGVFFPAADTVAVTTGGSERLRVDSSGNVGIGTSSPSKLLHTYRNNTDQSAQVQVEQAGSGSPTLGFLKTGVYSWMTGLYNSDNSYRIAASGADLNTSVCLVINTSQNLFMGTTSSILTTARLTVQATGGAGIVSATSSNVNLFCVNTAAASWEAISFRYNTSTEVGKIACTSTATTYTTSSDYRLKENVQPMIGALDTIAQLNPVTYTWKSDGSDGQGFIAHELQAVVPDCVSGEKDAVDEEGNPKHQGVDTSFLVATLVKGMQEQQQMIQALQARIAALEAK